jgi:succinate dehydrogenase (ubiquinone) cytochrome b560 subunit
MIATFRTQTPLTLNLSSPAATAAVPTTTADTILAAQRRNRPVSPHLTIYKPQITWIGSSLNRITGVYLSGIFYIFGIAYLAAPTIGWHLESASLAAAFASWPIIAKVFTKVMLAFPFTYHSLNGVRHLVWDTGAAFTNKQVIVTGWTVMGLAGLSALALAFL